MFGLESYSNKVLPRFGYINLEGIYMYLIYLKWLSCLRLIGVKELEEKPIRDTSGGLSRSLDFSVRRVFMVSHLGNFGAFHR